MQLTKTFYPNSVIFIEKKLVENQLWIFVGKKNVSWTRAARSRIAAWLHAATCTGQKALGPARLCRSLPCGSPGLNGRMATGPTTTTATRSG